MFDHFHVFRLARILIWSDCSRIYAVSYVLSIVLIFAI